MGSSIGRPLLTSTTHQTFLQAARAHTVEGDDTVVSMYLAMPLSQTNA
jgi:hypothetical protein